MTTHTWDALNRLTKARTATTEMTFYYDAFGRRAVRTETPLAGGPVKTTRFVYDGANVRLEVDGNGALLAANTHAGLDRLLGRNDFAAGASYYVHADGLGSTIALTDAAGQVVERYAYSAFGQLQVLAPDYSLLTTTPKVSYTYTGRDWEPLIGLYNYRARYYSPTMGRFISTDPIGFAAGDVNLFGYGGNNPIGKIDPYGLWGKEAHNVMYNTLYGNRISDSEMVLVKKADATFDSANQDKPYVHAMAAKGQTSEEAIQAARDFIGEKISEAQAYVESDNREKALETFVSAAHVIEDSLCPVHVNPDGTPRSLDHWWQWLDHGPNAQPLSRERSEDVTPQQLEQARNDLRELYDVIFTRKQLSDKKT